MEIWDMYICMYGIFDLSILSILILDTLPLLDT